MRATPHSCRAAFRALLALASLAGATTLASAADSTWLVWKPKTLESSHEVLRSVELAARQATEPRRLPAVEPFKESLASPAPGAKSPFAVLKRPGQDPVVIAQPISQQTEEVPPPASSPQSTTATAQSRNERTYGEAPTSDTLEFLRRQSVLLDPGDAQVDVGLVYTLFENDFPVPVTDPVSGDLVNVVDTRLRRRLLYIPGAIRYGLARRIQLFAYMPIGYTNTQTSATTVNFSAASSNAGVGDITAGGTFLLREGCGGYSPTIVSNVGFTAPTGKFSTPLFGLVPGSNLGQGFWAVGADALFINQYDPIVVFYGAGYRHLFHRNFGPTDYQPGEQLSYQFGLGFAVNDRVVLSTALQGLYITNVYLNDQIAKGTNIEPISLRFAATMTRKCRIIEPFALVGMTHDAPRAQFGVIYTFR